MYISSAFGSQLLTHVLAVIAVILRYTCIMYNIYTYIITYYIHYMCISMHIGSLSYADSKKDMFVVYTPNSITAMDAR